MSSPSRRSEENMALVFTILGIIVVGAFLHYLYTNRNVPLTPVVAPTWRTVANEGGRFAFSSPTLVRFGNDVGGRSRWVSKVLSGGNCNVAQFGYDPYVGVAKHCDAYVYQH